MKRVLDTVSSQGRYDEPERMPEPDQGRGQKHRGDGRLEHEGLARPTHHCVENVIRRDDDHDRGIEGAIAIETGNGAQGTDRQSEQCADQIRQGVLP